jgi:hypothetical protein
MGTKVKILTVEGEIRWPRECARCNGVGALTAVEAGIAKETTGLVDRLLGRRRFETYAVNYPVCGDHARFAAFASWLTRKSPLPTLLRWGSYLFGLPALLMAALLVPIWLLRVGLWLAGGKDNPFRAGVGPDFVFTTIFVAAGILFILVVLAYRRAPVRLVGLDDDAVSIRFASKRFARHFSKANADLVVPIK